MTRHYQDWLTAFLDYASYSEAPRHMHFWCGVSAIAGALRRRVWIDQAYFKWFPNLYICLVAPPGIVSKSTTADMAIKLLRKVPGIKFGPDVVTWPALVTAFAESKEMFEYGPDWLTMCAMTLESSEFGNLLDPKDKQMVDLLVTLWDGKEGPFEKKTKNNGDDMVENPWINMISCTTPSWIAGNFPEYMIGGGFTSRTIFVYADKKAKYVAYPGLQVPPNLQETASRLVEDLTQISQLIGEYRLTPAAVKWGEEWYRKHYTTKSTTMDPERFGGYLARKQTQVHKIAMILAASASNALVITEEHLSVAETMLSDLEPDMQFVFSKIGRSPMSLYAERLIQYVHSKGEVDYATAYAYVHMQFPSMREFEDVLSGVCRAGYITLIQRGAEYILKAGKPLDSASNGSVLGRVLG